MVDIFGNLFFLVLFFAVLISVYYGEKIKAILKKKHIDTWSDLGNPEIGEFNIINI